MTTCNKQAKNRYLIESTTFWSFLTSWKWDKVVGMYIGNQILTEKMFTCDLGQA